MKKELVSFAHLKGYAAFLLENHLHDFVSADIRRAREVELPLMQLLSHLSEEELFEFSKKGTKELLEQIVTGTALDHVLKSHQDWKEDKIVGVPRDKVFASDIALVYNVKKHSLLTFLTLYTSNPDKLIPILREIEDFYTFQESLAIQTFAEINQEELMKREERLKEAQAISHLGSWEWDSAKNVVVWSDEMYRLFGYEPGQIKINYEVYLQHIHPDDREMVNKYAADCLKEKIPYTFQHRIIRKDGATRWVLGKGQVSEAKGGFVTKISGIGLDITENKEAEDKIKESEALLLETQYISSVGSYDWNLENDNSVITPEVKRIFGYEDKDEVNFGEFSRLLLPDDKEKVKNALENALQTGETYLSEYRIYRKNDRSLRHVWSKGKVFFKEDGKPVRLVGSVMDITERKLIEEALRNRQAALEASNRELEAFCYTISHDLRSPLRAIDGFGRKLANHYGDRLDKEGQRLLNVVRNNAVQMGTMIDSLLEFSRLNRKELKKSVLAMDDIVEKVVEECREQNPDHQAAIMVGDLFNTPGDRGLLHQVWHNLLSNAIKFSSKAADPVIQIGSEIKEGKVVYFVRDNGAGFEMAYKDKLFGVFQRLHSTEEFQGNGVGLATVQRIIHRHGGSVWAEGELGKGATFYFTLLADTETRQNSEPLEV